MQLLIGALELSAEPLRREQRRAGKAPRELGFEVRALLRAQPEPDRERLVALGGVDRQPFETARA